MRVGFGICKVPRIQAREDAFRDLAAPRGRLAAKDRQQPLQTAKRHARRLSPLGALDFEIVATALKFFSVLSLIYEVKKDLPVMLIR